MLLLPEDPTEAARLVVIRLHTAFEFAKGGGRGRVREALRRELTAVSLQLRRQQHRYPEVVLAEVIRMLGTPKGLRVNHFVGSAIEYEIEIEDLIWELERQWGSIEER
jgi:hypothetical protein